MFSQISSTPDFEQRFWAKKVQLIGWFLWYLPLDPGAAAAAASGEGAWCWSAAKNELKGHHNLNNYCCDFIHSDDIPRTMSSSQLNWKTHLREKVLQSIFIADLKYFNLGTKLCPYHLVLVQRFLLPQKIEELDSGVLL